MRKNKRATQRIGITGISRMFGVGEKTVREWSGEFSFPRPVVPNVWLLGDVEKWAARNVLAEDLAEKGNGA